MEKFDILSYMKNLPPVDPADIIKSLKEQIKFKDETIKQLKKFLNIVTISIPEITHWDEHEICDNIAEIMSVEGWSTFHSSARYIENAKTVVNRAGDEDEADITLTVDIPEKFVEDVLKYLDTWKYNYVY